MHGQTSLIEVEESFPNLSQFFAFDHLMASSPSSSSSSSCDVAKIKHDVFISFRGSDVRNGFLSHLEKALRGKHINYFVDEKLDRGGEISVSLLRAIEVSQISLVIFSKDYASSKWCLEELAKIIECKEKNKQIVLSVFLNVDPSHVRKQKEGYGHALAEHEKLEENLLKAKSWRHALTTAGEISGFHCPTKYCVDESNLIEQIVNKISEQLSKFCSIESNGFVGMDQNIEQIQSLLCLDSSEVIFVGIWGMGGIGKTTIAHVIFDKYFLHYDGCCFLNVKEESEQHRLSLREKLISELLDGEGLHTSGISKKMFFNVAVRRISQKKVLVVLDDVNTSEQLKALVREGICFGPGSRVIITSRDRDVLTSGGVHQIHNVKEMDPQDSLKLFCLNAFNENQPKMGYEKLTEEVVKIAQGNPLALKVLGADFHSRSTPDIWECALNKIKKYPNEKIQSVLRFSYDGLHEIEKEAFLDIAFFFAEDDKDYVRKQLDACDFHGASGIEVLQRKALITISKDKRIQMHDLIRQMGWEIVRQESIRHPERRTRLRDSDARTVLRDKLGTSEVEAMQIDLSQNREFNLKADTFKNLSRLRFLKFYLPLHDELSMPPGVPFRSPKGQDALLSSVGCKKLISVASEIHIKCHDYLLIDGYSDPSSAPPIEVSRLQKITHPGLEIILSQSIGHLGNVECSSVDYQQFKNLPGDLLCFRCTYYLKLSKSRGQKTQKPKSLWHRLKLSKSSGQETPKPKLNILFDSIRYYRQISASEISFHNSIVKVPWNVGGFSWVQEYIIEKDDLGYWWKVAQLEIHRHENRLGSIILYQVSHRIANMSKGNSNCIANN